MPPPPPPVLHAIPSPGAHNLYAPSGSQAYYDQQNSCFVPPIQSSETNNIRQHIPAYTPPVVSAVQTPPSQSAPSCQPTPNQIFTNMFKPDSASPASASQPAAPPPTSSAPAPANSSTSSGQQDPISLFFSMLQNACVAATSTQPSSQIKDPEARMAKALEELRACPVKVPEGLDDRDAVLHAARFLGGPTCSLQHQWLLAREIHGLDGVTPLSGYDTDALGISGCVTSRGWLEIHNPANPHLKLKYFSSSNVGSTALSSRRFTLADGENSVDINESFKELMHMEDLRSAVHTLMKAMSLALPWNYSVSALESFLFGSSYCADKTSHWPNRAKELSDFVDHVLHSNARRWTTRQPFLDATTLRPVFETWVASRPAGRLVPSDTEKEDQPKTESSSWFSSWKRRGNRGGKSSNNNSNGSGGQSNSGSSSHGSSGGGGGSGGGGLSTARDWSGSFRDLCRRYNSHSGCSNSHRNCTTGSNGSGSRLFHFCSFKKGPHKPCGGTHPEVKHNK